MNGKDVPRLWVPRCLAALGLFMGIFPYLLFALLGPVSHSVRFLNELLIILGPLIVPLLLASVPLAILLSHLAVRRLKRVPGETAFWIAGRVGRTLGVGNLVLVPFACVLAYGEQQRRIQGDAIDYMRTLVRAETVYREAGALVVDGVPQYGTIEQLAAATPPFLDADRQKARVERLYTVELSVTYGNPPKFTCIVGPINCGSVTGHRRFFVDESGIIRDTQDGSVPNSSSLPLGGP
jgi:hypothetical protein